jgi:hypothetical protein
MTQPTRPISAPVAGHIHCEFQASPDSQLVECAAQMILDDLLGGSHESPDLTIRQALPNLLRDLNFFFGSAFARRHEITS